MGCDIHMYVEVREGKEWKKIGEVFDDFYNGKTDNPYTDRNYVLFALLADVRNFNDVEPIDSPRGLPRDVSKEIKEESDDWGFDGHSHSWYTLKELLAYNWGTEVFLSGCVSLEEFESFVKKGRPNTYCGSIGGPNVKHVSQSEMAKLLKQKRTEGMEEISYYTKVSWKETSKDLFSFTETLEVLKKLGAPEDVRIVFWFDN